MKKTRFLLLFVFLFILCFIPTKAKAATEYITIQFADNQLYSTMKEQLSSKIQSSNNSTRSITMTKINLLTIQSLNLSNRNITYLNGLDKFTNLTNLNLANNQISNVLPLKNLTNLKILTISQNKISNILPLSYLNNLTYLNVGNNSIIDISPVSKLTKLQILDARNNLIQDISSFSTLSSLLTLHLDENKIKDVSALKTLPNLKNIYLQKQMYEYSLQGNALANIETNVNLPTFFMQAKQTNSVTYTPNPFTVFGATMGNTFSYIVLKNTSGGQKTATVKINGGTADGSLLTLKYNSVLVTVTPSTSSPNKIYERIGGTISFSATVTGETSTEKLNITILKNNTDVTRQFRITSTKINAISSRFSVQVPSTVPAGTYSIQVKYEGKTAVKGTFTIYENIAVSNVSLNATQLSLPTNSTATLVATVSPANARNKNITWNSNNPAVVRVDSNGHLTTYNAGTAVITVTTEDGNKKATCTVTVTQPASDPQVPSGPSIEPPEIPVESIQLNKTSLTLTAKQVETLQATILPTTATNRNIIWSSSNPSIASVDNTGKVTGIRVGTTRITATAQDNSAGVKQAFCDVTVIVPLESITLDKTSLTLIEGQSGNLQVSFLPLSATNKKVTWSSSNPTIASVDSNGRVTGHKAGTTQIIVTAQDSFLGTKQAICDVTITPFIPLQSIVLNKTSLILKPGETESLVATLIPSKATSKAIVWESSDPSIVSIGYGFVVTAHKVGTAQIIATSQDHTLGTIQAICNVTVIEENISSTNYKIENNIISHIKPNSSLQDFTNNLQTPFSYKLYDKKGNEVSGNLLIGSGMYLILENNVRYDLVVTGDVSGDGKITATDVLATKRHIVKLQTLDSIGTKAADINDSNSISATDLLQMKKAVVGLIKL